jgi:hypothetical protein
MIKENREENGMEDLVTLQLSMKKLNLVIVSLQEICSQAGSPINNPTDLHLLHLELEDIRNRKQEEIRLSKMYEGRSDL